jgi:hypothetical protein
MTAEIAVLNRSAVSLAADSAGTIGIGSSYKIYNAFNKIFELSDTEPVAVMIYGGLDFMGLPLEVLIKDYRRRRCRKSFPTLRAHADDFREYLTTFVGCSDQDHLDNGARILVPFFQTIASEAQNKLIDDAIVRGRYLSSKSSAILGEVIKLKQEDLKSTIRNNEFLNNAPIRQNYYDVAIKQLIDHMFKDANQANRKKLLALGRLQLMRGALSSGRTGIVVAGFGADEMCPSLEAIETDGLVFGRLKFDITETVDIGRKGPHAAIVGFAQDDMVGRFMDGVDPAYETYVLRLLHELNEEFLTNISRGLGQGSDTAAAQSALAGLRQAFSKIEAEAEKRLINYRNDTFRKPITEMIRFMPNQELATLAASLIDLTSLKRRVSRERETVGGDVDVATISKAEGFVWIKRKHYFPAELNPRFFNRMRLPSKGGAS